MTRKHFIAIARAIRESIQDKALREVMANALVPTLRALNSQFNAGKFLDAAVGN